MIPQESRLRIWQTLAAMQDAPARASHILHAGIPQALRSVLIVVELALSVTFALPLQATEADDDYAQTLRLLREAQRRADERTVIDLAKRAQMMRGDLAGVAEAPDRSRKFTSGEPPLTPGEIKIAFKPYYAEVTRRKWWRIGDDPGRATRPLRDVASVIVGCTFACRAGCDESEKLKELAYDGAAYLIWAQRQAGSGLFPFPAAHAAESRPFVSAMRLLQRAERQGILNQVVVNNWIVNDLGDGGLQFDNGSCGVALLELYRLTGNTKYLKGAEEAAAWSVSQPAVPNWNYNSFSVYLLSEVSRETGNENYRRSAVEKARLGIYPGQITSGPHRGRWFDSHNSRPEYHFLLVRSLVALTASLEPGSRDHQQAMASLRLALEPHDKELASGNIVALEPALEALLLLDQYFPNFRSDIGEADQSTALRTLGDYCVRSFRQGRLPVAPGAWGRYLENVHRMEARDDKR